MFSRAENIAILGKFVHLCTSQFQLRPDPPPGNCGALARLVSPGGGALANLARPGVRALANPGVVSFAVVFLDVTQRSPQRKHEL